MFPVHNVDHSATNFESEVWSLRFVDSSSPFLFCSLSVATSWHHQKGLEILSENGCDMVCCFSFWILFHFPLSLSFFFCASCPCSSLSVAGRIHRFTLLQIDGISLFGQILTNVSLSFLSALTCFLCFMFVFALRCFSPSNSHFHLLHRMEQRRVEELASLSAQERLELMSIQQLIREKFRQKRLENGMYVLVEMSRMHGPA